MADSSNHIYYYLYNLQGDVIALADATTGKLAATYSYDAWGKCVSVRNAGGYTIGTANPFRYRGYYFDNETGFYYLNSRYYNPEVGRFLNADAFVSTNTSEVLAANLFVYCKNNMPNAYDPNGTYTFLCREEERDREKINRERAAATAKYNNTNVDICSEGDKPEPGKIVVIINPSNVDKNGNPDPNIRICNSNKIRNRYEIEAIINVFMNAPEFDSEVFTRDKASYVNEWVAHNILYDFAEFIGSESMVESARHVDLNENENRQFIWWGISNFLGG